MNKKGFWVLISCYFIAFIVLIMIPAYLTHNPVERPHRHKTVNFTYDRMAVKSIPITMCYDEQAEVKVGDRHEVSDLSRGYFSKYE